MLENLRTLILYPHHHHVVPLAWISRTLSRHFSLSFITFGRSSGLHPVSSHSCCMYVWAGRPAFAWPYVGVHRSTSLMSLSLLLQQCLVCLTCIVFVMEGKWPYSWCRVLIIIQSLSLFLKHFFNFFAKSCYFRWHYFKIFEICAQFKKFKLYLCLALEI